MLRVAVLTDDRLFHAGLGRILESDPSFAVVAHGADGAALSDVLLVDCRVDGALQACAAQRRHGGAKVIVVAAPDDDGWAPEALAAGARGILSKSATAEDLVKAIRVVESGLIWAPRRVIVACLDRLTGAPPAPRGGDSSFEERLSGRERDVFRHAAAGLGNREVASRLNISQATVKVHLTRIFQKLGLRGRNELAAAYHGIDVPQRERPRRPAPVAARETHGVARAPVLLRRSS
jgi:DNA-binding NarL/FixJ family response regulator